MSVPRQLAKLDCTDGLDRHHQELPTPLPIPELRLQQTTFILVVLFANSSKAVRAYVLLPKGTRLWVDARGQHRSLGCCSFIPLSTSDSYSNDSVDTCGHIVVTLSDQTQDELVVFSDFNIY